MTKILDRLLERLPHTELGREALAEADRRAALLEERKAARAKLDRADADQAKLPELAEAAEKAKEKRDKTIDKAREAAADAVRAYHGLAQSSAIRKRRADSVLRNSADPLVNDRGPVTGALLDAQAHLRSHVVRGNDRAHLVSLAGATPRSDRETGHIERATRDLKLSDAAEERIESIEFALSELRELQLEVEVDRAEVEEIVGALSTRCPCGEELRLVESLDAATSPKESLK